MFVSCTRHVRVMYASWLRSRGCPRRARRAGAAPGQAGARRAQGVLLGEQGPTQAEVARFVGTGPLPIHRVRAWQERFVAQGRAARPKRPPTVAEVGRAARVRLLGARLDAVRFADAPPPPA
jgi:hypothetical protein